MSLMLGGWSFGGCWWIISILHNCLTSDMFWCKAACSCYVFATRIAYKTSLLPVCRNMCWVVQNYNVICLRDPCYYMTHSVVQCNKELLVNGGSGNASVTMYCNGVSSMDVNIYIYCIELSIIYRLFAYAYLPVAILLKHNNEFLWICSAISFDQYASSTLMLLVGRHEGRLAGKKSQIRRVSRWHCALSKFTYLLSETVSKNVQLCDWSRVTVENQPVRHKQIVRE